LKRAKSWRPAQEEAWPFCHRKSDDDVLSFTSVLHAVMIAFDDRFIRLPLSSHPGRDALIVVHDGKCASCRRLPQSQLQATEFRQYIPALVESRLYFVAGTKLCEHDLDAGLRNLRLAIDSHIITSRSSIPLLIRQPGAS
jgi:hypothetical protein